MNLINIFKRKQSLREINEKQFLRIKKKRNLSSPADVATDLFRQTERGMLSRNHTATANLDFYVGH